MIVAMPIGEGPTSEHRRWPRKRAKCPYDVVGRAGHEVVVDEGHGLGFDDEIATEGEGRHRRVVPKNAVASARKQQRDAGLSRILLGQLNGARCICELSALLHLMLAEPVELVPGVGRKGAGRHVGADPAHRWSELVRVGARFGEDRGAGGG